MPQAIEVRRKTAKAFTRGFLSRSQCFTHMTDAMGRSRMERFYAFVQTKDTVTLASSWFVTGWAELRI